MTNTKKPLAHCDPRRPHKHHTPHPPPPPKTIRVAKQAPPTALPTHLRGREPAQQHPRDQQVAIDAEKVGKPADRHRLDDRVARDGGGEGAPPATAGEAGAARHERGDGHRANGNGGGGGAAGARRAAAPEEARPPGRRKRQRGARHGVRWWGVGGNDRRNGDKDGGRRQAQAVDGVVVRGTAGVGRYPQRRDAMVRRSGWSRSCPTAMRRVRSHGMRHSRLACSGRRRTSSARSPDQYAWLCHSSWKDSSIPEFFPQTQCRNCSP